MAGRGARSVGTGRQCARHGFAPLAVEALESRWLPTATPLGELVGPNWFEDLTGPADPLHAGSAGWSAAMLAPSGTSVVGSGETYDWIVRFDAAVARGLSSVAQTASLLVGSGVEFEVLRGLGLVGQVLVRSYGAPAETVATLLAANPSVEAFEQDGIHQLWDLPNDPAMGQLWALENTGQNGGRTDADIDAAAAWQLATGSRSTVVAVVDTGIDWRHVDLAQNIWTNPGEIPGNRLDDDRNGFVDDVHGYDFVNRDGDPMDDNGHGTHVAGTIAAVGNNGIGLTGINWSASVMALKFLGRDGSGYTSDAVRAINYATMMRARYGVAVRVINASWGGAGFSSALRDALAASSSTGILCVAAAGNRASNNDAKPHYPSSYDVPNLLAVAATDRNDQLASFSNYGATSVDLAAPGVSILSTYPGNRYVSLSGTSMAAPHVSGVAALAWSLAPEATPAQVVRAVLDGVDRLGSLSGKVATGGRLNAATTLRLIQAAQCQPPQIGSLVLSPQSAYPGTPVTLLARGVADPDGTVTAVWFGLDWNGNGRWDAADRILGSDSDVRAGEASVGWDTSGWAPGSYRVFAQAQDNHSRWSAPVVATLQLLDPDDHGNTAGTATQVLVGNSATGRIASAGDRDWFRFHAVAGRHYLFRTQLGTLADSVLTLYGPEGSQALASNDNAEGRGLASEIRWTAPSGGTYYLEVQAAGGSQGGTYVLELIAPNAPPQLAPIADQQMSAQQDAITLPLYAHDPDGDVLTFTVQVLPADGLAQLAYQLDRQWGLYSTGNYLQNYQGAQEKWMWGADRQSYFIVPSGALHRWAGSIASSPVVATLSPRYWSDPRLLHDAPAPEPSLPADAVTLRVQQSALTIDPRDGLVGQFCVRVVASDGLHTDTRTFKVTVVDTRPKAASCGDRPAGAARTSWLADGSADLIQRARAIDQLVAQTPRAVPTGMSASWPTVAGPRTYRPLDFGPLGASGSAEGPLAGRVVEVSGPGRGSPLQNESEPFLGNQPDQQRQFGSGRVVRAGTHTSGNDGSGPQALWSAALAELLDPRMSDTWETPAENHLGESERLSGGLDRARLFADLGAWDDPAHGDPARMLDQVLARLAQGDLASAEGILG